MILQVVIIRRSTKEVLFNYCFESEKHIDEVYLSQFAVTIAEVIPALFSDSTERIQFMKTSLHKVVFEVFDDYIFVIISTADTDDLELNLLFPNIFQNKLRSFFNIIRIKFIIRNVPQIYFI
ncbi:MAG: hypothetical protein ACTSSP_05075 [Candidatus Asgardarchaeia archaeon]